MRYPTYVNSQAVIKFFKGVDFYTFERPLNRYMEINIDYKSMMTCARNICRNKKKITDTLTVLIDVRSE